MLAWGDNMVTECAQYNFILIFKNVLFLESKAPKQGNLKKYFTFCHNFLGDIFYLELCLNKKNYQLIQCCRSCWCRPVSSVLQVSSITLFFSAAGLFVADLFLQCFSHVDAEVFLLWCRSCWSPGSIVLQVLLVLTCFFNASVMLMQKCFFCDTGLVDADLFLQSCRSCSCRPVSSVLQELPMPTCFFSAAGIADVLFLQCCRSCWCRPVSSVLQDLLMNCFFSVAGLADDDMFL